MPFKSRAQRRKFAELLVRGEITPETFEEWNRETGSRRLPERVTRAKRRAAGTRARTTNKTKPKAAKSKTKKAPKTRAGRARSAAVGRRRKRTQG
jgi:hypothetical protein